MKVEQRINRIASERIRFSYNLAAVLVLIMHCSGNLPVRDNWSYSACKIIAEAGMIGVPWFGYLGIVSGFGYLPVGEIENQSDYFRHRDGDLSEYR